MQAIPATTVRWTSGAMIAVRLGGPGPSNKPYCNACSSWAHVSWLRLGWFSPGSTNIFRRFCALRRVRLAIASLSCASRGGGTFSMRSAKAVSAF